MNRLPIRSRNWVSESGPAVDRRLYAAHSTRSASGTAAASRSVRSPSHQRSSIFVRRRPRRRRGPRGRGPAGGRRGRRPASGGAAASRPRATGGRTSRRRWPARSRPTRISPSSPSKRHGLAPQLEHVHGRLEDRPLRVLRGERRVDDALRRREQPLARARCPGSPAPPGSGEQDHVRARAWPAGDRRPTRAARARRRRRCRGPASGSLAPRHPVARRDPAEHRRDEALRPRRPRAGTRSARPSRARARPPRRLRVIAAACQPHDGRTAGPNSGSSGSVWAASRPSTQAVAVVLPREPVRDWGAAAVSRRRGGSRGRLPPRARCSASSSSAPHRGRRRLLEDRGRRRPRRGSGGPRRGAPGPGPTRRSPAAGRSRARAGCRPRTRATGCARATGRTPGGFRWPPAIRSGGDARPGVVASRLRGRERVEEREAQRRLDRRGAQVLLDPLEDRAERRQLPRRVEVEELEREVARAVEHREPVGELRPDLDALAVERLREVLRVERRLALLAAAELVAADRTAVVLADRPRTGGRSGRRPGARRPRSSSSRTTGRSQVAQRLA